MICVNCGAALVDGRRLCQACGQVQPRAIVDRSSTPTIPRTDYSWPILYVMVIMLAFSACFAIHVNSDRSSDQHYRLRDGRWSDDQTVQLENLQQESAEKHAKWQSDCRVGIRGNPECP